MKKPATFEELLKFSPTAHVKFEAQRLRRAAKSHTHPINDNDLLNVIFLCLEINAVSVSAANRLQILIGMVDYLRAFVDSHRLEITFLFEDIPDKRLQDRLVVIFNNTKYRFY